MITLDAKFEQMNPDGSRDRGQIYIHRPGRIRFEYEAPNSALIIAISNTISVFDPKGDEIPNNYPLDRTPLRFVLASQVDLTDPRTSAKLVNHKEYTILRLNDPDHPGAGNVDLFFRNEDTTLSHWLMTNGNGETTRVALYDVVINRDLPSSLFNVSLEIVKRQQ